MIFMLLNCLPDLVGVPVFVVLVLAALFGLCLDGDLDDGAGAVEHLLPDGPVVLLVVERVDLATNRLFLEVKCSLKVVGMKRKIWGQFF